MRRRVATTALALTLVALSGCDQTTEVSATVELVEFSISGPQSLSSDASRLEINNVGEYTHTLVITDADGEVAAATGLVQPGETTFLDLDLEPGQYVFTCRMIAQNDAGDLIDHFESGMHAGFTVDG